ncbi:MAG: phosphoserine phosphatase SerB [Hyphomicrobiales bacterium]|nr:phosphoserine phosphatase SerB [Hyphomicrobiales bacterium]
MASYTHVATLVSNPQAAALSDAVVASAAAVLADAGTADWLAPGIAADIPFSPPSAQTDCRIIADALRGAVNGAPVDVIVQPLATRAKKLFLADMDSTIIGQECIDELADVVGVKAHVAAITERAMRGEIEFEPALRERVGLLKGLDVTVVDQVIAERISLNPGARTLVQTMRARGVHTMLVSGGFTLFTSRIAEMTGFHENRANELIVEAGRFAGRVREPILGKQAKLDSLLETRARLSLTPSDTMAVGDGANDLAMLDAAGLGFAYHAKPAVAAAADVRIDHADLTALLYAQGLRRTEFTD